MPNMPGLALPAVVALPAALALCAVLARPAAAADQPDIFIAQYGEYTVQREDPLSGTPQGSSGVTERVSSVGARLLRRTARIAAGPCRRFGVWFQVRPPVPAWGVPITTRLTHPVMIRPDGQSGTVETDEGLLFEEPALSGFSFTYDWEMVPGTWTFSVLSGGKVLAEQAFEVTAPPAGTALPPGGCDAPVS